MRDSVNLSPEEIAGQIQVLEEAAEASPIRQVKVGLRRRAKEWATAARDLSTVEADDYELDLVGGIVPGDRVLVMVPSHRSDEVEAAPVMRVLHQNGQSSIHVVPNATGRDLYLNYAGPESPVVVRR